MVTEGGMKINVLKFGGTSMNDHRTWRDVLEIIRGYKKPVVVVSATARTTRQLVTAAELAADGKLAQAKEIAEQIYDRHYNLIRQFLEHHPHAKMQLVSESCDRKLDEKITYLKKLLYYVQRSGTLSPELRDAVASVGEQISSFLFAQCGLILDMPTQHIEAKRLIKTDAEYGNANPNRMLISQKCGSLETVLESGFIPVIGGYYGEAPNGTTTTLGFEGSDYTASLIGAGIHARTIEIWTDVSGVYTCDPRYIQGARPITELSYYDATEMAYFGAKVLHPSTLKPAQERNIPVLVKNMFKPEEPGTRIVRDSTETNGPVLAMSIKENMNLMTVSAYETVMGYSFLTQMFATLEKHRQPVDAVNTTEASVTLALENSTLTEKISKEMIEFGTVDVKHDMGLISLIGCTLDEMDRLTEEIFSLLGNEIIEMITFTRDKRILSFVVDNRRVIEVAQRIHDGLFG